MLTAIQNGVVMAWQEGRHQVLHRGVVVYEGDEIVYVGEDYRGDVDETIDATDRLVIPGFVNTHLHVTDTLFTKGYLEDLGRQEELDRRNISILYRVLPAIRHAIDPEAQTVAAECAFSELAQTGSTTVVELGYDYEIMEGGDIACCEQVTEAAARVGLRCYVGPRYRNSHWGEGKDGKVFYRDYPNSGRDRFEACVNFCREWNGRYDDRIRTMLAPGQVDTCDSEMLVETRRTADELGVPIQLHAGQSSNEFQRIRKVHGKTTVEYLADVGLLGPDFIIGHGLWLSENGDVKTMGSHEIDALRDSGTTIAHLPWVFARSGRGLNSLQKYLDAGIRLSLGTDTFPFDMFNEMRFAAVCCKFIERSPQTGLSKDIFRMATVGGADALGRADLGRLALGCKADIVLVRVDTPRAVPLYDPFKFLVLCANGSDVDTVIVAGTNIVKDGEVLTVDTRESMRRVNEASERVWSRLDL